MLILIIPKLSRQVKSITGRRKSYVAFFLQENCPVRQHYQNGQDKIKLTERDPENEKSDMVLMLRHIRVDQEEYVLLPPTHVERLIILEPFHRDWHGGIRLHLTVKTSRGSSDR